MSDPISFSVEGRAAVLALDDGKANAAGFAMLEAINAGLDRALEDADAVVVLGRPGILSGGFDLAVIRGGDEAELNRLVRLGAETVMRLYGHPQPVVVGAPGHAVALGAFFLLAADHRIGVDGDFKLGLNETAIGLTLPPFGIELARARLSPRHLTASAIGATLHAPAAAVEAGFLDEVVPPAQLAEAACARANAMAELDGPAFAATKQAFRGAAIERVLAALA